MESHEEVNNAAPIQEVSNEAPSDKLLEQRIKHLELNLKEYKEREEWLKNQVGNFTDSVKSQNTPKPPLKNNLFMRILALLCLIFGISLAVGHLGIAALK